MRAAGVRRDLSPTELSHSVRSVWPMQIVSPRNKTHPSHICYTRSMTDIASRELRNQTRSLLDRVASGERLTITVDGRPVAELGPVARRSRWMHRDEFVQRILANQADAGLTAELESFSDETTDDLRPL